jgi:outer membrane receptor for ferrienterochelin and colicins
MRACLISRSKGHLVSAGQVFRSNLLQPIVAATLAGFFGIMPVQAQSVDYSGFEQLLGEPVTTSATGKPQRMSEVPANMEIITADDIRRSGADNIPDILQFIAGMDVRRYGFAAADVSVRGYNETSNPRLLVLLNGQQVYLDDLGRTQWYTLPVELDEIRQIEIVKGPNTALFGFNAASGVINIITYDPITEGVNTATTRVGTQRYTALSAVGTGRIADVGGVRLSAGGFRAQDYAPANLRPYALPFHLDPERNAFSFDARARVTPDIQVFASGAVVQTRMGESTASPLYGADYQRTNWARAGLTADTPYGLMGLSVYRNELLVSIHDAIESQHVQDTVVVVQATDLVKLNQDHTVRISLDYRNNAAASSGLFAGHVGYDVYSAGAMWNWQITPAVALTNAVRFDHFVLNQQGPLAPIVGFPASAYHGRTIDEPSFNIGLVWKATDSDTFRLLAARGLQLPSVLDLGLQDRQPPGPLLPGILLLGNPRIKPAIIRNLEFDWDRAVPGLNSTLRTAVFIQRTDDIITNPYEAGATPDGLFPRGIPEFRGIAANVGNSTAAGAEIGLRGHALSGFRWNASYSFISIADHTTLDHLISPQNFARGTPTHVVVLGGGYTYGPWEFDVQSRLQSWYVDYRYALGTATLETVKIGNYLSADARIGYRLTDNVTVALSSQQFNVSHLTVTAAPPVERRVFLSVTVHL